MDARQIKSYFSQIIHGFSAFESKDFGEIYIKHFNSLDAADIDIKYNSAYSKGITEGLSTQKAKEQEIIKSGLWSEKQERDIKTQKDFVDNLSNTFSKEYLKSRRDSYKKTIDETNLKIRELENTKSNLIGITAELFAIKKSNEYYIECSFFKNRELTIPLLSHEEYEELETEELNRLMSIFTQYNEQFVPDNIKRIASSSVFLNMFYLSAENPQTFYGKPIVYLTYHQIDLYSYGRYMKNVLSEYGDRIPKNILNDGEKLSEWLEINKNADKVMGENKDGGAVSYVGARKEDLEYLLVDKSQIKDFKMEAEKRGKSTLTLNDLMEIEGN